MNIKRTNRHHFCNQSRIENVSPMYLIKTPKFIKTLFPNFVWNIHTDEKVMYLTFDDGPIPEVTPWVLDTLKEYNAKATFFCVGDNITKHPDVLELLLDQGHTAANHTYHHMAGWSTENIRYFHDVRRCAQQVRSNLFRPPYGRIRPSQAQFLTRHYQIVMWDVLSGDFDRSLSPDECAANILQKAGSGSIVVFHDSLKAQRNMKYALQKTLDHYSALGYRFESLNSQVIRESTHRQSASLQTA